ncbi:replication initiation protein [Burkholderia contaminans]|nr:replication initiation protein [Burkholderia contaminans]
MKISSSSGSVLPGHQQCKRYERTGLTSRWAWEDFRHAVVGIVEADSIYQQYKFFKSKILKRAIAEVNDLSDIEVTLKEYKNGRVVEQIQFEVRKKNSARPALESEPEELSSVPSVTVLLEDVLRLGVTPNRAAQIINEYTPGDIRAALNHTVLRDAATNMEPLKNRASFFICSLEKGYAKPVPLPSVVAKTEPSAPALTDASLRESFMRSRDPLAEASFLAMALDEQSDVLHDYNSRASHEQLRYDPAKKSKLSKTAFIRYLNLRLWGEPSDADVYAFHFPKAVA